MNVRPARGLTMPNEELDPTTTMVFNVRQNDKKADTLSPAKYSEIRLWTNDRREDVIPTDPGEDVRSTRHPTRPDTLL
jgi:hypothetical protein